MKKLRGWIIAYSDGSEITWNCAPSDSWKVGEPRGEYDVWEGMRKKSKKSYLQKQAALVYNLLRKVIGSNFRLPSVEK